MEKEIKGFVEVLKKRVLGEWHAVSLSDIKATPDFNVIAMDRTVAYADENDLLIFINNSGVKKTNEQLYLELAEFDYSNEELLNEFKDEVYGEIEIAIAELGGESVASSPDEEEFKEMCIGKGISQEDIGKFGTLDRFDLVCKF